jgi:phosphonate transport system substrate-binding protein
MDLLRATSCMAPTMDPFFQAVIHYVAQTSGIAIEIVNDIPWPARYQQLDGGEIQIAWICGAPYCVRSSQPPVWLEPLAAPVWRTPRYSNQPVYYSQVVVPVESPIQDFAELRGKRWVYNEPDSLSGYHIMRAHLAQLGEGAGFFRRAIAAGSHQCALQMVADRQADVAAIDSTVFEQVMDDQPELAAAVRTITWLGPSPIPPWVIRLDVAESLRQAVGSLLLLMAQDTHGATVLAPTPIARFASVTQESYQPVARLVAQSLAL